MLDCQAFYDVLDARGLNFYAGVPDSLLKDFCGYVTDTAPAERNIITANEGSAVGMAAGHFMATGRPGIVYMQNSGLGNAVNPITSLADPAVYGIPMLIIVGWRGEPGKKDEPQHVKMGSITRELVDAMGLDWAVLPDNVEETTALLERATKTMNDKQAPFVLLVPKGTFAKYSLKTEVSSPYELTREQGIGYVMDGLADDALIVATTGKPARELFELRRDRGQPHGTDFLTVGSMGHSSQIALGVALSQPKRNVYCLDGDGAALMHLGGLATIGTSGCTHYRHVVLNNGAHDSVGGQPTVAFEVDLCAVAKACGYSETWSASTPQQIIEGMAKLNAATGPAMLEVRVKTGARADLGRPTMKPPELKRAFMAAIAEQ